MGEGNGGQIGSLEAHVHGGDEAGGIGGELGGGEEDTAGNAGGAGGVFDEDDGDFEEEMDAEDEQPDIGNMHVHDLHVDGELPPPAALRVQDALASNQDNQLHLQALQASNDDILAAHPPVEVAAEIRRRLAKVQQKAV